MGQKVQVTTLCDMPHPRETEADEEDSGLRFSLNGEVFEIDLCVKHGKELRGWAAQIADHGRKVAGGRTGRAGSGSKRVRTEFAANARGWYAGLEPATRQRLGLPDRISDRGRVPAAVAAAYRAAVNAG